MVFRRDLTKQNLLGLFGLARKHGAHEVRIHQPIPRGELTDPQEAEEVFHTKEDTARLTRIQLAVNRAQDGSPKVTSLSYTEGPHKFGCGAGVLHAYISGTGDLWPCDFVPLSFGNVVDEDLKGRFGEMIQVAGAPRTHCLARAIAARLLGQRLPLGRETSTELCRANRTQSYPRFFKDLQGG